jgi:hypothetical protein
VGDCIEKRGHSAWIREGAWGRGENIGWELMTACGMSPFSFPFYDTFAVSGHVGICGTSYVYFWLPSFLLISRCKVADSS